MTGLYRLASASCALLALTAACASEPFATSSDKPAKSGDEVTTGGPDADDDDDDANAAASGPTATTGAGPTTTEPAGLIVIDLQNSFFSGAAANPKMDRDQIRANAIKLMKAAGDEQRPVFVTYEASKTGEHAMPAVLKSAEPPGTKELVKTTFGAMGLPAFATAIRESGVKRWVVIGAETDVCVLQTMLGLRNAGMTVVAATDALMTEEENATPARRRMEQAGIVSMTTDEAVGVLAGGPSATAPATAAPKVLRPLETGIVLSDVAGIGASDANAAAKKVRLRELFLVSEWFKLPILAADPAAAEGALPSDLKSILTRPILALADRPATVKHVVVAGGTKDLAATVGGLGSDVWLLSDGLVGSDAFEPLYVKGAVPTTYKSLYYELTVSVDDRGWPSPQWVTDGDVFFDRTKAPEDLPPLSLP